MPFKTLTYKHEVHDAPTHTIINLLDNEVISCTYQIDTANRDIAHKIKQAIFSKYGIDSATAEHVFCLIDEFENKIIYQFEHDHLVIHYIAAGQATQEKIKTILTQIEEQKQRLLRKEKHQMELAF